MECHGGRLMECHDDRKNRARESNVALQDLEKTTLSTRAARGWRSQWMMPETRSQKLGRGQRTVYEQAKKPELQNTVMDDRRADPQRVSQERTHSGCKEHSQLQASNEDPGGGLGQDKVQDRTRTKSTPR